MRKKIKQDSNEVEISTEELVKKVCLTDDISSEPTNNKTTILETTSHFKTSTSLSESSPERKDSKRWLVGSKTSWPWSTYKNKEKFT